MEQMTIDGELVPHPLVHRRQPSERQMELVRFIRARGGIGTNEARPFYANPKSALARLARLGIVECIGGGHWRPRS